MFIIFNTFVRFLAKKYALGYLSLMGENFNVWSKEIAVMVYLIEQVFICFAAGILSSLSAYFHSKSIMLYSNSSLTSSYCVQVKVVLRADISPGTYEKVAIISGVIFCFNFFPVNNLWDLGEECHILECYSSLNCSRPQLYIHNFFSKKINMN